MEIIKAFKAGEILFNEGDPCDSLFIIKVGKVEIFKQKTDREIILNVQKPGEVIGLLTFFNHGRRLASARAQVYTEGVLIMRKAGTEPDSVTNLPQWVQIVLKEFTLRLEQMNEKFMTSTIEVDQIKSKMQDPLFVSIQIANCVTELGAGQAITASDGTPVLKYEELKVTLGRCLEYDLPTVDRVFEIFDSADLLKIEKEPTTQRTYISLEGARNLAWYPEFFRSKPSNNKKLFSSPLSDEHRRVLLGLCEYVHKTGGRQDQIYIVEVPLIASCLENMAGVIYDQAAVDAGAELGLLEVRETAEQLCLHFHPNDLKRSLQVVEIVSRLRVNPHFV